LIELAVVMVIATIVVLILLPTFRVARIRARETKCLGRIRQVGMGFQMYQSADHGNWPWARRSVHELHPEWPDPTGSLARLYPSYVSKAYLFQCPSTKDVVRFDPQGEDFLFCREFYVGPRGETTRPRDEGKLPPNPPSYFYDAGAGGRKRLPSNANVSRVIYGDECVNGVQKEAGKPYWLGENNHKNGGHFLFVDMHAEWLYQSWIGVPNDIHKGRPYVTNPYIRSTGVGTPTVPVGQLLDMDVFTPCNKPIGREYDADLSGMMWLGDSWREF
jgi:hypothetical protein